MVNTRKEKRKPVTLKIKFKSATLGQFIERYSVDVSHGGIFIRTKDPLQVGTPMRFEFQLQDASPLISGEGTVVWTREHDPSRGGVSPGMGVRFDKLGGASKEVLQKILAQKAKSGKSPKFDANDTSVKTHAQPPRAPGVRKPRSAANLPLKPGGGGLGLAPRTGGFESDTNSATGSTPLPKPMPFHSTVDDDFSNEVFDQPTRVAALDEIMREGKAEAAAKAAQSPAPAAPPPPPKEIESKNSNSFDAEVDTNPGDSLAEIDSKVSRPDSVPPAVPPPAVAPPAVAPPAVAPPAATPPAAPAVALVQPPLERPGTAVIAQADIAPAKSSKAIYIALSVAIVTVVAAGAYVVMKKQQAAATDQGTTDSDSDGAMVETVVPPPPIDAEIETGIVAVITSQPEGATVLVDGTEVGTTPYRLSGLEDGDKHKIEIIKACYKPVETKLVAAEGATIEATLKPFIRLLRVTSEPANATLYVDGKRRGHTPRDVRLVGSLKPQRPHLVRVTKPRHEAAETKVTPDAPCKTQGRVGVIEVALRLVPKEQDQPSRPRSRIKKPRDKPKDPPDDTNKDPDPVDDPEPVKDPPKDDPEPVKDPPKNDSPVKDDSEEEHTPDWMKDE